MQQLYSRPLYRLRSSITLVGLAAFVATSDEAALYSALVPVLPYSLVDRSGIAEKDVQFWTSSMLVVFGVVIAATSPFVGWACGHFKSMQYPYLVAQFVALLATLCMCFGKQVWILLVARALQAVASSGIYVSAIGMIVQLADKSVRGAWIGFAMSGLSTSLVVTPTLSGWLYEHAGYYPVFAMITGVIVLAMILGLAIIEPEREKTKGLFEDEEANDKTERPMDRGWYHSPRCEHEHTPLLFPAYSHLNHHGATTISSKKPRNHLTTPIHTIPLIISSTRLRAALFGALVHAAIITSFDAILPLFLHRTFSWPPSLAGTAFLFLALPTLLSPLAGILSDRIGAKRTACFGFGVCILGISPLAVLVQNNTTAHKVVLCAGLVVTGMGLTFVLCPLAADVCEVSEGLMGRFPEFLADDGGSGTTAFALTFSTFNMAIGVASALGPAGAGALYHVLGWGVTMGVLTGFCAVAGVVLGLCAGDILEEKGQHGERGCSWTGDDNGDAEGRGEVV